MLKITTYLETNDDRQQINNSGYCEGYLVCSIYLNDVISDKLSRRKSQNCFFREYRKARVLVTEGGGGVTPVGTFPT